MKKIAIIPARSGSKGLKDKNIKLLNGKPLIAYTIEAAIESNQFDEIMVSTDSEVYADIAREYGASVPFLRSESLASDTASSWDAVKEALGKYNSEGKYFDTVALLQPTSPLRTSEDIINGFKLLDKKDANTVVGVCEVDHSPLWANILPKDNSMEKFIREDILNLPRQKIETYYRINGALYIVKTNYLMTTENIYKDKSYAYVMGKRKSIDVDDEFDFDLAEVLINRNV